MKNRLPGDPQRITPELRADITAAVETALEKIHGRQAIDYGTSSLGYLELAQNEPDNERYLRSLRNSLALLAYIAEVRLQPDVASQLRALLRRLP